MKITTIKSKVVHVESPITIEDVQTGEVFDTINGSPKSYRYVKGFGTRLFRCTEAAGGGYKSPAMTWDNGEQPLVVWRGNELVTKKVVKESRPLLLGDLNTGDVFYFSDEKLDLQTLCRVHSKSSDGVSSNYHRFYLMDYSGADNHSEVIQVVLEKEE
jgi:hypothetical protein